MAKSVITIGKRKIGQGFPCFIVAELSGNHHQSYDKAVELIHAAAKAGCDAVKLQTYTPDTITVKSNKKWFVVGGEETPEVWKGKTLHDLYQTAYTPWKWQPKLKKNAENLGLILFSAPFDETAVNFLEKMDIPCYKVGSYEVTHIPLLKRIAKTRKPVIMSIGFATLNEIEEAVKTLRKNGTQELAILHCLTTYSKNPKPEDANLATIQDIEKRFKVAPGFSDNNAGIETAIAAVMVGAKIIEKHFIISRAEGGSDAHFSIEPEEMQEMIKTIRTYEKSFGRVSYGPANKAEKEKRSFRQSVWAIDYIKKGEKLTEEKVKVRRPAVGLEPKYYEQVLGKIAKVDIELGTPITRDLLE